MSNTFIALIPFSKTSEHSIEVIANRMKQEFPQAQIKTNSHGIGMISGLFPIDINRGHYVSDCWEIEISHHYTFMFDSAEDGVKHRLALRKLCSILGCDECWFSSEMVFFSKLDVSMYENWTFDKLAQNCDEYVRMCQSGYTWAANVVLIHYAFTDLSNVEL